MQERGILSGEKSSEKYVGDFRGGIQQAGILQHTCLVFVQYILHAVQIVYLAVQQTALRIQISMSDLNYIFVYIFAPQTIEFFFDKISIEICRAH